MIFSQRVRAYYEQAQARIEGRLTYIPFEKHLPIISRFVPGIIKGTYYAITAFPNIGKTPLAKYLFVDIPFEYYKQNNMNIHILFFCLEESEEQFTDSLVSAEIFKRHGFTVGNTELNSFGSVLKKDTYNKVTELAEHFADLERVLTVVDNVTTPEGIIKIIQRHAATRGRFYNGNVEVEYDGQLMLAGENYTHYEANNESEITIIVIDHLGLLANNRPGDTTFKVIERMSKKYLLQECVKSYKYAVCAVHQQAAEGENAEYAKLRQNETTLQNLGDCKLPQRDYLVVFGLNMPQKYGIVEHNNLDISKFGDKNDRYRSLTILKNRYGRAQVRVPLWFTPEAAHFKEIKRPVNYQDYV
jgi:hypothetical protein